MSLVFDDFVIDDKSLALFNSKINKLGPKQDHMKTRCWDWNGAKGTSGHPKIGQLRKGKSVTIYGHRLSYWLKHRKLRKQDMVCHKCDYPPCTRPSHLFKGDHTINMHDMQTKGRAANRGTRSWNAVLKEVDIIAIRKNIAMNNTPNNKKRLALKYKVSIQHIRAVARGKFWAHIT